ncbi:hypothetical protein [Dyella sp. KRB-257]|uniref:hypothetical protein n=1 Tax=Dyella sp. KRB-257 TaxID=3400915 RepID=UPI003C2FB353
MRYANGLSPSKITLARDFHRGIQTRTRRQGLAAARSPAGHARLLKIHPSISTTTLVVLQTPHANRPITRAMWNAASALSHE